MHLSDAGQPNRAFVALRDLIDETRRQHQLSRLPRLLESERRLLDASRVAETDPPATPCCSSTRRSTGAPICRGPGSCGNAR